VGFSVSSPTENPTFKLFGEYAKEKVRASAQLLILDMERKTSTLGSIHPDFSIKVENFYLTAPGKFLQFIIL